MFWVFLIFLLLFFGVGLLAARRGDATSAEYYLANRSMPPWMVGLSAVSTNNSGYMFLGMVGYAYMNGLVSLWLAVGFIGGDFLSSLIIHRHFRRVSEIAGEGSYAGVLSGWYGTYYPRLRALIGFIALVFLLVYMTAQLSAMSKTVQVMGGDQWWSVAGPYLGFVVIVAYCFWGGMRASIWTDIVQAVIMMVSLLWLLVVLFNHLGGAGPVYAAWLQTPEFLSLNYESSGSFTAIGLFVLGWIVAGMNVIGQPHIMSRFLTLNDANNYHCVRPWYYLYYLLLFGLVIAIGMLARIYLPELQATDPELAFPTAVINLFPPALAGLMLAGVFAATMSTADSQIMSCSAILFRDLGLSLPDSPAWRKTATLVGGLLVLVLTLVNSSAIFDLVIFAWSAMGSAFGPLILIYVLGFRPTQGQAITMVLTGVVCAIGWRYATFHELIYEGLPAAAASLLIYFVSYAITSKRGQSLS